MARQPTEGFMRQAGRPLSPHLQIYKLQLTSVLSISHRATGLALSIGTLLLVWWLLAAASGPAAYAQVQAFLGSWLGVLVLVAWSYALFFHLCNGIRHLLWDTGYGLDIATTYATGWAVVAASAALTVIALIAGIMQWQHA
jgi:succinate dehydrogenase / fumarate reductase, cytochrome b subunit